MNQRLELRNTTLQTCLWRIARISKHSMETKESLRSISTVRKPQDEADETAVKRSPRAIEDGVVRSAKIGAQSAQRVPTDGTDDRCLRESVYASQPERSAEAKRTVRGATRSSRSPRREPAVRLEALLPRRCSWGKSNRRQLGSRMIRPMMSLRSPDNRHNQRPKPAKRLPTQHDNSYSASGRPIDWRSTGVQGAFES
ncbi:hypothetical protein CA51_32120 [Rosistilla oblonga]|nr:hypothetical protein CA51_32120 [Rosistilla oblonga]